MNIEFWYVDYNGKETPHVQWTGDRAAVPGMWPIDHDHSRYNNVFIGTYPGSFFTHYDLDEFPAKCKAAGIPNCRITYDFPTFSFHAYFNKNQGGKTSYRWKKI